MSGGVVVVGAGHAGTQVAASLRDEGYGGRVVLVGDEPGLPYRRPPLSKECLGRTARSAGPPLLRGESFFARRSVEYRPGVAAVALDRPRRRVRLSDGGTLRYERLVLATGAAARDLPVPGAGLAGVVRLRSRRDAEGLRTRLGSSRSLIVVGAGFLGLEVAAAARDQGVDVLVLEAADRVLARSASAPTADFVRARHERSGVSFAFADPLASINGVDGAVASVRLASGTEVPADTVLLSVGAVPRTGLAARAGLTVDDGIVVDGHLLTEDRAVGAVGDCARHPDSRGQGTMRPESVQSAVDQARCLAAGIAGRPYAYEALPHFWSDQGPVRLQLAGLLPGHDDTVVRGSGDSFSVFCYREGRLVCVESVSAPSDHMLARRLLAAGQSIAASAVSDPGLDLRAAVTGLLERQSR